MKVGDYVEVCTKIKREDPQHPGFLQLHHWVLEVHRLYEDGQVRFSMCVFPA